MRQLQLAVVVLWSLQSKETPTDPGALKGTVHKGAGIFAFASLPAVVTFWRRTATSLLCTEARVLLEVPMRMPMDTDKAA